MRKNHNKLYYGRFRFKTEFRLPGSLMFYPTTDEHLIRLKKEYADASDMNKLADFIIQNRHKIKFRFQDRKAIFYTDRPTSLFLIENFWDFWTGSETVDPKFTDLGKNVTGCARLPHGKYKYQVHLKKGSHRILTKNEVSTLKNYIESNKENYLASGRDVIAFLNSEHPYFTSGYFYVSDDKFLTPIYMIAQAAIDKVIEYRKVKNGSNKKTTR
jgi:hypothetical protein